MRRYLQHSYPSGDLRGRGRLGQSMELTTNEIINLHDYVSKGDVTRDVGTDWQYMGHPSPALYGLQGSALAAPFVVNEPAIGSRVADAHEATARYRQWLWQQITSQYPRVLDALRAIGPETVLACWCDPTPCYCQVIARAATWLRMQETTPPAREAPAPPPRRMRQVVAAASAS